MLKKITAAILILFTVQIGFVQCYGGFRLTKKFDDFVRSIGNKWIRWIIFLFTFWLYGLTILADVIIFNSIEFWAGYNPIGLNEYDKNGEYVKTEQKGDEKTVFIYRQYGQELRIMAYKNDKLIKDVLLKRDEPEVIYAREAGGLAVYRMNMQQVGDRTVVQLVRNESVQQSLTMSRGEYAALLESKKHLVRPELAAQAR